MIGYYYIQCRVLALNNFTTTDDPRKGGAAVDVECHGDRMFVEEEYLESSGYKLRDYCLRTVRQRIRKLLCDEGVEPEDWSESKAAGLIRAPGDKLQVLRGSARGSVQELDQGESQDTHGVRQGQGSRTRIQERSSSAGTNQVRYVQLYVPERQATGHDEDRQGIAGERG